MTPATVIGFLTILGYSLYDTVVVFDKVRENTAGLAGGSRMTYSQAANLAVNQTLVRSINTSIIALLPIGAILFAGIVLLGAGPLKDLALALFVGVAVGAYSSIFIATPHARAAARSASRRCRRWPSGVAGARAVAAAERPSTGARGATDAADDVRRGGPRTGEAEPATGRSRRRGGARPERPPARRPATRNQPRKGKSGEPVAGGKKRR